jgi:hypothetical protein
MRGLFLAAVVLCTAGCAAHEAAVYEADAPPDPSMFSLRGEGYAVTARVGDRAIESAEVSLGRFRDRDGASLRGTAFGRPVNLDADAYHVAGLFGAGPLNITVRRWGDEVRMEGLARGRPTTFHVSPGTLVGTIGACSYRLMRTGLAYEGRRSCGGPTEQVELRLPVTLARWSDGEAAAALVILLGAAG